MFTGIVLLGTVGVGCTEPVIGVSSSNQLFLPDISLVRGRAMKVEEKKVNGILTQKAVYSIDHVYVGDAKLKGQTFRVEVSPLIIGMRPVGIESKIAIKKGERGVWWIRRGLNSEGL